MTENAADDPRIDSPLGRVIRRNRHPLSSAAISLAVHTVMLLGLGFIWFAMPREEPTIQIRAEIADELSERFTPDAQQSPVIEITVPDDDQSLLERESTDQSLASEQTTPSLFTEVESTSADQPEIQMDSAPIAPAATLPRGGGLNGRQASARAKLASKRGGSQASELAVERGLRWLVNHQQDDGSWRLDFRRGPCQGRCRHPGTKESTTAATGLALMALLGAGYTHQAGPYQDQVRAGLEYLMNRMRTTYFGGNLAEGSMYAQGIATIALAEAYAMTRDPNLRNPIELARKR